LPREPVGPLIAIVGALPWALAAGLLGSWEAMLVGFTAGLLRSGLHTHSFLAPLHYALAAGLLSWLIRRDYADWLGRALRNPLIASLISGAALGLLGILEHFVYSGGAFFDALDYAISLLGTTLLASVIETGIAGLLALGVRWRWSRLWTRPTQLVAGPYQRSMAARYVMVFLLLGSIASLIVLAADWLLAKAAAEDMLATQMSQTAVQAGEGIPYFIQTGRTLIRSLSDELDVQEVSAQGLADSMRQAPYFGALDFVSGGGDRVVSSQGEEASTAYDSLAIESTLALALAGVPQEIVLPPESTGAAARMGFFSPVYSSTDETVSGALVGWTALDTNPLLQPVVQLLSMVSPGEAYIVDGRGVVVIHPGYLRLMEWEDLSGGESGTVFQNTAPDGTLQSVFVYDVDGYPWRVVVTTPQRVVNSLAVRIAASLFLVLAIVGILLVVAVYLTSRRLTLTLRKMASAAEAIAAGEMATAVEESGEDEVGRLAISFERMRSSLKSRLDDTSLLLDVNQHLASSFELKQALPPILSEVQTLCGADLVRLLLIPGSEGALDQIESYQAGTDPGNWVSIDEQVIALCQQGGRFVLDNPSRASAVLKLGAIKNVMATILGIPLQSKDLVSGVMWIAHKKPHAYSATESRLLEIIARQLEASVTNVRLYRLAEQERLRLGAVLEATPGAVIVTDSAGDILLANPAAEVVLRGQAAEAVGNPAADWLVSPELADFLLQSGAEGLTAEIQLDDERVMFVSASEVRAGQELPAGRVCVLWDITHYKQLDSLKSEFLASVGYDLRTPLAMMHGYARMLRASGGIDDQQIDLVSKIEDGVERMTRMVDNLLDQGRLEAGFGLNLERTRLDEVILQAVATYRPRAENKQIELSLDMEDSMDPILADAVLLRQAIGNLLDNAVKFTRQHGKVQVLASQQKDRQVVCVRDNGIGIAPADLARIFEKFYRAGRQEKEKVEGPGLGLSLARSIAERHGGRLTAESQLGEGSAFTLELPLRAPGSS
jgi:signal transduction histidine kinase/HAMP domain-containing protein